MDYRSQLASGRPIRSKAIPIINPDSGERKSIPTSQRTTSAVPASLRTTGKKSTKVLPSTPTNAKTPSVGKLEDGLENAVVGQAFDVYARPFVPETLSIINTLSGQRKIDTPAMKRIDFGAYVSGYIGLDFLPPTPKPLDLHMCDLPDGIIQTQYEQYFRHHLDEEIESQKHENASYSLYGHEVTPLFYGPDQSATCSLLVPGLRENSPYVEEDDVIQLRQLRYDQSGRLLGMDEWMTSSNRVGGSTTGPPAAAGQWRDVPAPGWSGIVYDARVSGVLRKKEQLFVKVCGITSHVVELGMAYSRPGENPRFNVQFPAPEGRYLPMRQALAIVQAPLRQTTGNRYQYRDTRRTTSAAYAIPAIGPQSSNVSEPRHHWLRSMLFPAEVDCEVQTKLNPGVFNMELFDEQLNWEQQKAIESICSQKYGALPFLISGPPGTGKTKTLVETALQLISNVSKASHILLCAPSDPAADTLVQRLRGHLGPAELLRLNRPSRTFAEVSDTVLPYCYTWQDMFYLPPFRQLMAYKIVVTTCRDAAILMNSRMTNSDLYAAEYGLRNSIHPYDARSQYAELHWAALLIDEAAQAMEPDALIPLAVIAPPSEPVKLTFTPLVVMAGDEHQLGPRTSLHSSPLKTSLFARLFARPVYADHPLARDKAGKAPPPLNGAMLPILHPAFANLIRNYRSHPAILAVPSALFYADTLEPEATDTNRLASWSEWRGMKWPVLFHSNDSEDELEKDGGGWYNISEAQSACRYAASLIQTGLITQNEVCIVSPFKAQVQRLRKTIREQRYGSLWNVDIGPTEAFQGLERGVVILCTTRSKQRFISKDKELDWGIIGMPNKMNVALTRAKFGLIVIGKKEILLQDPNWKAFLDFCERNGLVAGKTDRREQHLGRGAVELTRLEKVLLTRERDLNGLKDSRVLKVINKDDEMWTNGMQTALNMDGYYD